MYIYIYVKAFICRCAVVYWLQGCDCDCGGLQAQILVAAKLNCFTHSTQLGAPPCCCKDQIVNVLWSTSL